jgi:hypothetical protein
MASLFEVSCPLIGWYLLAGFVRQPEHEEPSRNYVGMKRCNSKRPCCKSQCYSPQYNY